MDSNFYKFVSIVKELRGENGCAWDKKHTLYTLKDDFIEEAYELVEGLENKDIENIKEELGDVLLHVVMHSNIAQESGFFDIEDVINDISEKIVRRHPHVFESYKPIDNNDIIKKWEEIKMQESGRSDTEKSILKKAKKPMPALIKAQRLQEAASKVNFDWNNIDDIFNKLDEEINELKQAIKKNDTENAKEEIGDTIFVLANIARKLNISAEESLKLTNLKFIKRFTYMEKNSKDIEKISTEELEALWQKAKSKGL